MLFRLILLLAIAGTMTLFTLQNLSPVLPLVFLGSPTLALPLSWWILGAIAAGALTTIAITFLVGLSNFLTGQAVRSQTRSSRRNPGSEPFSKTPAEKNRTAAATAASQAKPSEAAGDAAWQDWRGYETSASRSAATPTSRSTTRSQSNQNDDLDDWERGMSDDWNEAPSNQPSDRAASASSSTPRDRFEQPKQSSRSGSAYSYSYGESEPSGSEKSGSSKSGGGKSGGGKTEQVVDADFRVLVPPYRALEDEPAPTPSTPPSNPDSWFEDEEDGDDRRSQR